MKILIVDDVHQVFHELMESNGNEVFEAFDISKLELIATLKNYDALVVRSKFYIDKDIIDAMKKDFIVLRAGAGMDNIDEEYAKLKSIKLVNAPEGNRTAVAEHVVGLLLALSRNICISDAEVRQQIWRREENRGFELKGKTIGIIGYGNTGKELAKKLSGFEMKVIAYDKYLSNFSDSFATEVSINELQNTSDIISLHVPLTSETSHLINAEFINKLNRKAIIINASRGKVIKTSDLIHGIKIGKVMGAALDVLENEQLSKLQSDDLEWYNELITMKNVVLTSHIAGWTFESYYKISEVMAQKLLKLHYSL